MLCDTSAGLFRRQHDPVPTSNSFDALGEADGDADGDHGSDAATGTCRDDGGPMIEQLIGHGAHRLGDSGVRTVIDEDDAMNDIRACVYSLLRRCGKAANTHTPVWHSSRRPHR